MATAFLKKYWTKSFNLSLLLSRLDREQVLGLSLSYDIVKAHGGEIKVNTKENEGTEFAIKLPA
jgi:nitrogen-specific signal transduction histidine kinase